MYASLPLLSTQFNRCDTPYCQLNYLPHFKNAILSPPQLFLQNLNPYNLLLVQTDTLSLISAVPSQIKFRAYYPASNPFILSMTTVTLTILSICHNEIWLLFNTVHCNVTLQIPLRNKTKKMLHQWIEIVDFNALYMSFTCPPAS